MADTEQPGEKVRKRRRRGPKDRSFDFYERWRWAIWFGGWGFLAFQIFGFGASYAGSHKLARVMHILGLFMPVIGVIFHEQVDRIMDKFAGQLFWPEGKLREPAHSEGEALYQRQDFEGALDWFAAAVAAVPTDWRAQLRIVEILLEQFDDRTRVAEERSRLLRIESTPEGLWMETALALGRDWVVTGHPDRAVNVYKGLLWKIPEGPDAEEARRRLADLGAFPRRQEGESTDTGSDGKAEE